jgi:ELWxxDGT repeat protein
MKTFFLFTLLCLLSTTVKSQYVEKVTSINYYGYNGLNPSNLTVFNGKLYFLGTDDPQYVDKLMFTADGSAAGVTVVKQIDSVKQYPSLRHLTVLNNILIFDNYNQLWKSDGTTDGTSSLADIKIGSGNYAVLNNKVYFAADITNAYPINDQLWQTDGTVAGTTLLKTINSTGGAGIFNLFSYGGKIYFGASDGTYSAQLWVSDGTTSGTILLKLINPTGIAFPQNFIAYNGKVYFSANDGVNGTQLWVTDGTTQGTLKVTNINTASYGLQPSNFTLFNSKLFFMGVEAGSYYQLWSTDGTAQGTVIVKADYTPRNGVRGFYPSSMAVHSNVLYMAGYDSLTQLVQLWKCDGTTAGTSKITSNPIGLSPSRLFSFQSRVIFTGSDTLSQQTQLFASDGTADGTVCPTPPETWGQYPFYPWEAWVPFNNALYYKAAYSYFADYQLCRYTELPSGIVTDKEVPEAIVLSQNYPNPFNPTTTIGYQLPVSGQVTLKVYDVLGKEIASLVNEYKPAGSYEVIFNATGLSSGIYLYKLKSESFIETKKMIVLK